MINKQEIRATKVTPAEYDEGSWNRINTARARGSGRGRREWRVRRPWKEKMGVSGGQPRKRGGGEGEARGARGPR